MGLAKTNKQEKKKVKQKETDTMGRKKEQEVGKAFYPLLLAFWFCVAPRISHGEIYLQKPLNYPLLPASAP